MSLDSNFKYGAVFLLMALWPGFLLDWSLEWVLVITTTLFGAYLFLKNMEARINSINVIIFLASLLVVEATFSHLYSQFYGKFNTGTRDYVDLVKPLFLVFSCLMPFRLGFYERDVVANSSIIILIYSLFAYFSIKLNVPIFSEVFNYIYSDTKLQLTEFTTRLTVPFENPNFLGFFAILSLHLALFSNAKHKIILAILAIIVVGLTGSRTAWVTGIIILFAYYVKGLVFHGFRGRSRLVALMIILVSGLAVSAEYFVDFIDDYQRLANLYDALINRDLSRDSSYGDRVELRLGALKLIQERPFFGHGAVKYSGFDVVDNQYYGIVLRYGFFGASLIFTAFALYLFALFKRITNVDQAYGLFIYFLIVLAWLWAGNFIENIRLSVLLIYFLSALTYEKQ